MADVRELNQLSHRYGGTRTSVPVAYLTLLVRHGGKGTLRKILMCMPFPSSVVGKITWERCSVIIQQDILLAASSRMHAAATQDSLSFVCHCLTSSPTPRA